MSALDLARDVFELGLVIPRREKYEEILESIQIPFIETDEWIVIAPPTRYIVEGAQKLFEEARDSWELFVKSPEDVMRVLCAHSYFYFVMRDHEEGYPVAHLLYHLAEAFPEELRVVSHKGEDTAWHEIKSLGITVSATWSRREPEKVTGVSEYVIVYTTYPQPKWWRRVCALKNPIRIFTLDEIVEDYMILTIKKLLREGFDLHMRYYYPADEVYYALIYELEGMGVKDPRDVLKVGEPAEVEGVNVEARAICIDASVITDRLPEIASTLLEYYSECLEERIGSLLRIVDLRRIFDHRCTSIIRNWMLSDGLEVAFERWLRKNNFRVVKPEEAEKIAGFLPLSGTLAIACGVSDDGVYVELSEGMNEFFITAVRLKRS